MIPVFSTTFVYMLHGYWGFSKPASAEQPAERLGGLGQRQERALCLCLLDEMKPVLMVSGAHQTGCKNQPP